MGELGQRVKVKSDIHDKPTNQHLRTGRAGTVGGPGNSERTVAVNFGDGEGWSLDIYNDIDKCRRRLKDNEINPDGPGARLLRRRRLKAENRPIHALLREIRKLNGLPPK